MTIEKEASAQGSLRSELGAEAFLVWGAKIKQCNLRKLLASNNIEYGKNFLLKECWVEIFSRNL
ncbi:hypothetical protein [Paenibacillus sp. HGF7]|uniref:hypothetical protein n=1 Tax=Paenibacillus sp. HGF7 TaxID=944559 RepID=UPI0014797C82|nr:hypothetical protein [Paenibacillus sp. HGF7]